MNPAHLTLALTFLASPQGAAPEAPAAVRPARADAISGSPALVVWGDLDADGLDDAVALERGTLRLLHNAGDGSFEEVTVGVGLAGVDGAALVLLEDFDRDGRLDLFVGAASGPCRLFRNGESVFEEVTRESGLDSTGPVLSAHWLDYDADGAPDLHLTTSEENVLWHATAPGVFERVVLPRTNADAAASGVWTVNRGTAQPVARGGAAAEEVLAEGAESSGSSSQPAATSSGQTLLLPGAGGGAEYVGSGPETMFCPSTITDQATGSCLMASTEATLGMLYPLSDRLFVDEATGRVGIGTIAPESAVHVRTGSSGTPPQSGALLALESGGATYLNLLSPPGAEPGILFGRGGDPAHGGILYDGSQVLRGLQFRTGGNNTRMVIDESGNVGVGTNAPARRLHVRSGDSGALPTTNSTLAVESADEGSVSILSGPTSEASLFLGNAVAGANAGALIFNPFSGPANSLVVRTADTNRMTIDADGDVGIGTSSPASKLDVAGAIAVNNTPVIDASGNWVGQPITGGGGSIWSLNGSTAYYSAGDVGIGVTVPEARLHVGSPIGTPGSLKVDGAAWFASLSGEYTTVNGGNLNVSQKATLESADVADQLAVGTSNPPQGVQAQVHGEGLWVSGAALNPALPQGSGSGIRVFNDGSDSTIYAYDYDTSNDKPLHLGRSQNQSSVRVRGQLVAGSEPTNGVSLKVQDGSLWVGGDAVGGLPVAEGAGIRIFNDGASGKHIIYAYDYATGTGKDMHLGFAGTKTSVSILEIRGGADLVEGFDTTEDGALEPGTVVVIDPERTGALTTSTEAYDFKVAGVVSGAGGVEAGIHLGQDGVLDGDTKVAMTGRVYVKCSAENGAIRPGDRLTTAALAGHAMKATDASRSDGAVIGKAMSSLDEGAGLVLVLVNLQ